MSLGLQNAMTQEQGPLTCLWDCRMPWIQKCHLSVRISLNSECKNLSQSNMPKEPILVLATVTKFYKHVYILNMHSNLLHISKWFLHIERIHNEICKTCIWQGKLQISVLQFNVCLIHWMFKQQILINKCTCSFILWELNINLYMTNTPTV